MSRSRHASLLLVASAGSAVLAYVFFVVTTRALGAEGAAPVTVLWSYWSFAGAALTFPLQHWITRSVTVHGGEGQVRAGLARILLVLVAMGIVVALVAWLVRDPLLRRDDVWFPLMLGLVTVGSGVTGIVRGALTARGQFGGLGASLVLENLVRVLAVVLLVVADVRSPAAYGLALVVGYATVLAFPSGLRFSRGVERRTSGSPVAFLGGTASGQLFAQTVLTGGPVLAALLGGAPGEVTALFAALALFRAPYTLAVGVAPKLTAELSRLVTTGSGARLRRVAVGNVAAVALLTAPVGLAAASWGGPLLRLVFGDDVVLAPLPVALVAVGCLVALSNLVSTVIVMAAGHAHGIVAAWTAGLLAAGGYLLVSGAPVAERTSWAFVVAEGVALLGLLAFGARPVAEERAVTEA